jgi:hypothetical protein
MGAGVTSAWVKGSVPVRVILALSVLVALASVGHYAYGEMQTQASAQPQGEIQTQALAQPQQRDLYKYHEAYKSSLQEDESVHGQDLDNRADMLGVQQDLFRGATNFTDPGYRDLPNAPQMQLVSPSENDHRTANGTQP